MITRLAVRLERAGLFFTDSAEDLIGDGFGNSKFIERRMIRMRNAECGMRNLRPRFKLIQASIYRIKACLDSRQINRPALGIQQFCDLLG